MATIPRTTRKPGFLARFSDICKRCQGDVEPGQRVVRRRGGVMHVGCASGQDDE